MATFVWFISLEAFNQKHLAPFQLEPLLLLSLVDEWHRTAASQSPLATSVLAARCNQPADELPVNMNCRNRQA